MSGATPQLLRRFGDPQRRAAVVSGGSHRGHVAPVARAHAAANLRARGLRLPGARALGAVAALPGAPAGAGHHLRPHRRVRLVEDRAARGRVRLDTGSTTRCRPWPTPSGSGRDVHADGDAPGLADPQAPGDPAGRARTATSATSARASTTTTPARSTASTPAASRREIAETLRAASGRRRLADRQRVGVPRHDALLRSAPAATPSASGWKRATGRSMR